MALRVPALGEGWVHAVTRCCPFSSAVPQPRACIPAAQEQLLPVPTALFQGSLLLGSVAQAVLGPAATGAAAFVHPALIAGWAGLVGSALNSLPVGSLDGGRMIQARAALSRRCPGGAGLSMPADPSS